MWKDRKERERGSEGGWWTREKRNDGKYEAWEQEMTARRGGGGTNQEFFFHRLGKESRNDLLSSRCARHAKSWWWAVMNFVRAWREKRFERDAQHPISKYQRSRPLSFSKCTPNYSRHRRNGNRKIFLNDRGVEASCNCGALQDFQSTGATLVGGIILLRQIESDAGRCIRPYGCQSSPGRKSWQDEENVTARMERSNAQTERRRGRERESGWNGNWKRGRSVSDEIRAQSLPSFPFPCLFLSLVLHHPCSLHLFGVRGGRASP